MVTSALSVLCTVAAIAAAPCLAGVQAHASAPATDTVSHAAVSNAVPLAAVSDTVPHAADTVRNIDGPLMVFKSTTVDFGVFKKNEIQEGTFVFSNGGNEPLTLIQVFTGCGCTVTSYSRTPVMPGDSAEIKVRFDGSGRPPGRFMKIMKIRSNAVNNLVRVYVTGIVKQR